MYCVWQVVKTATIVLNISVIGDNPFTVPLHPPETLLWRPWERTRTSAATERQSYDKTISCNLSQYWQDLSHGLLCFLLFFVSIPYKASCFSKESFSNLSWEKTEIKKHYVMVLMLMKSDRLTSWLRRTNSISLHASISEKCPFCLLTSQSICT